MDYRHTFLRDHIAAQLKRDRPDVLAVEHLIKEIERCSQIDQDGRGVDRHHPAVKRCVNLRRFFYGDLPDLVLYRPVRVRPYVGHGHWEHKFDRDTLAKMDQERFRRLTERKNAGERVPEQLLRRVDSYDHLSQVMQCMHSRRGNRRYADQRGIVLLSRSGAGKTTASWKALYDCLFWTQSDDPAELQRMQQATAEENRRPALDEFLPCWLPLDASIPKRSRKNLLAHLTLLAGLKLDKRNRSLLKRWLRIGPPLLIFADLNRADATLQEDFATAMLKFQIQWGKYGHRCVVTFRSARLETGPMAILADNGDKYFGFYDLLPLDVDQATHYLGNLREFEHDLASHPDKLRPYGVQFEQHSAAQGHTQPGRDPETARKALIEEQRQLFAEFATAHTATGRGEEESIISTPLLMHLFTILKPGTLRADATLAELCGAVIDQYLDNDFETYRKPLEAFGLKGEHGKLRVRIAMTRLALAIQALSLQQTWLPMSEVRRILRDPQPRAGAAWQLADEFWRRFPVYTERFGRPDNPHATRPDEQTLNGIDIDGLCEFSFFRREGRPLPPSKTATSPPPNRFDPKDRVGLLHDAFIYHLSAAALVEYERPGHADLPGPGWCDTTAMRIGTDVVQWHRAALFLAGRVAQLDYSLGETNASRTERLIDDLLSAILDACDQPAWIEFLRRFCRGPRNDSLCGEIDAAIRRRPGVPHQFPESAFGMILDDLCRLDSRDERILRFIKRSLPEAESHA